MKVAYVHNLPLEYYPPATNFLDLIGLRQQAEVRVYTTCNRKQRAWYENSALKITRSRPPNPAAASLWRMVVALWWHLRTAISLVVFRPNAIVYIEPHSAIAVYLYRRILRGSARLFIHHHEYYEREDYARPGMRVPQLGNRLERSYLFQRAEWISQTNIDRLQLAQRDNPEIPDAAWHVLPNYPPSAWAGQMQPRPKRPAHLPVRLIYVGSASFEDTYIREIVRSAAACPGHIALHICGYNVAPEVLAWLEKERYSNVTFDANGYDYEDLPAILSAFDIGLVLYKGNTTNFIFNVPNKVFEYIRCGLEVWYPREMAGIRNCQSLKPGLLRELDFTKLDFTRLGGPQPDERKRPEFPSKDRHEFTAEQALAPMFALLGIDGWEEKR
jgi:hypothetical protein